MLLGPALSAMNIGTFRIFSSDVVDNGPAFAVSLCLSWLEGLHNLHKNCRELFGFPDCPRTVTKDGPCGLLNPSKSRRGRGVSNATALFGSRLCIVDTECELQMMISTSMSSSNTGKQGLRISNTLSSPLVTDSCSTEDFPAQSRGGISMGSR